MVAILLAMIGLLGTVAIQQTMMNGNVNASEAGIASRLATMKIEGFSAMTTRAGTPATTFETDQLGEVIAAKGAGFVTEYYDRFGKRNPAVTQAWTPDFRFEVRSRVCVEQAAGTCTATANPGAPYNITVIVIYGSDTERRKEIRIDVQRRKSW